MDPLAIWDPRLQFEEVILANLYEGRAVIDLSRRTSVIDWHRLVIPRLRTASLCGLQDRDWQETCPEWVVQRVLVGRLEAEEVLRLEGPRKGEDLDCQAELALVLAERHGFLLDGQKTHTRFKFIGTKTGRFGVETGWFNPMTIAAVDRGRIRARPGTRIASLDFVAMDLCSMLVLEPSLHRIYEGAEDLHLRTTEWLGMDVSMRDHVKEQTFVYVYGGRSDLELTIAHHMPEMTRLRERPGTPLLVQERSATTFRWALGSCLDLLMVRGIKPLFPVHDELVVEYSDDAAVVELVGRMQGTATRMTGVPHRVRLRTGETYSECKDG